MIINFKQDNRIGTEAVWGKSVNVVKSLHYDSRKVQQDAAFFCMKGENQDGHLFMEEAIHNGASVIVGTREAEMINMFKKYKDITYLLVEDSRSALSKFSVLYYQEVYKKLTTIGVTGTNGKTTVVAYIRSLLNNCGIPTGSVGTVGALSSSGQIDFQPSTPTTPEAPELHHIFHQFHQKNEKAAAMEVSSIAIEQKRVEGIYFDIGVHTNISTEHLEYHKTFANYKRAKLKLFQQVKKAVVNRDDKGMGKDILDSFQGPVITYSVNGNNQADVTASKIKVSNKGTAFELRVYKKSYLVHAPVFGAYNISNLLASICTALQLDVPIQEIVRSLSIIESPQGRFQLIETPAKTKIILDYAHTPTAIAHLLEEVKKLDYNKIILMITGVGIRDESKMPKMAEAADGHADEYIVSVDHPGFKQPEEIIKNVLNGFSDSEAKNITPALTRKDGVISALLKAEEDDLIVLTGGCINGCQLIKGESVPHSDESIIEEFYANIQTYKPLASPECEAN
ncbi:UDP-N-acetylmuramoyl-L-alanyl-D-glutamate--2,6-diaminopimelate ligase [Sediminibacillus albus]|uniref:UDP-N-acetylmuramoyl-L-alanyl-D-glutamate--2,6-diaminopimelate ligase n=1 Tax=Sediminibacillus albus TaxID=407036 RepID=A0A1G8VUM1_9BACI|nr:UDP-N-acetylmuramoyl-L-alanyl-D-glutamate--2,6-diaminopimelate ligase [Sediminibacillus albus]SDJ69165.1 UDP-N-acetylmuramoyl-L-alanyl-D-glutamate--2,6-diaminopimelate ligase [Sediminibacillus albus]